MRTWKPCSIIFLLRGFFKKKAKEEAAAKKIKSAGKAGSSCRLWSSPGWAHDEPRAGPARPPRRGHRRERTAGITPAHLRGDLRRTTRPARHHRSWRPWPKPRPRSAVSRRRQVTSRSSGRARTRAGTHGQFADSVHRTGRRAPSTSSNDAHSEDAGSSACRATEPLQARSVRLAPDHRTARWRGR